VAKRRDTGSGARAAAGSAASHGQRGLSPAARATALSLATRNARFLAHLRPSQPIGGPTQAFLQPLRRHAAAPARATLEQPGHGHDAAAFAVDVQRRYDALPGSFWPREEGAFAGDPDLGLTLARVGLHTRPARQGAVAPSEGPEFTPPAGAGGAPVAEPPLTPRPPLDVSSAVDEALPASLTSRRPLSAVDPRLTQPVTTLRSTARPAPRSAAGVTLPDMVVTRPMDDWRAQEANSGIARRQPARVMAALGRPLPLSVVRTPPRDNEETDWSVAEGRETASNVAPFTSLPGMFDLAASVQRKPESGAPSPGVAQRIGALHHAAQSAGQPLDVSTRRAMQAALGTDFPDARVHADSAAAEAASALGARAFTLGDAVYFAQGAFAPHTASGAALLGHELVHTLQQSVPVPASRQQPSMSVPISRQQPSEAQNQGALLSASPYDAGSVRQQPSEAQSQGAARLASVEQAHGDSANATSDGSAARAMSGDVSAREAAMPLPAASAMTQAAELTTPPSAAAADTAGDMALGQRAIVMSGEHIALVAQGPAGAVKAQGPVASRAVDTGSAGVSPVPVTSVTAVLAARRGERQALPDTGQASIVSREPGGLSSLTRDAVAAPRTGADGRVAARARSTDDPDGAGWGTGFWPVAPGMGLLLTGAPVGASRSVYAALDMARALNGAPARMGVYGAGIADADGGRTGHSSPIGRSPGQPAYAARDRSLPFVGMWGRAQRATAGTTGVGGESGAGSADSQLYVTIARSVASAADALPGALDLAAAIGHKASASMRMAVPGRLEPRAAALGQESIIGARGRVSGGADAGPDGMRVSALLGTLDGVARVAPIVSLVRPGDSAARSTRDGQAPDASGERRATSGASSADAVGAPLDGTPATPASFGLAARTAGTSDSDAGRLAAGDVTLPSPETIGHDEAIRRADVVASGMLVGRADASAPGTTVGRADAFAPGMTDAAVSARRGLEAREGDGRVADDVTAVSTMFPSLAGLAALQSYLPAALGDASISRGQSYLDQPGGSFYRGAWQPVFVPAGTTSQAAARSLAAAGAAATGLTTGASAPGSASGQAPAATRSTMTLAGPSTTAAELSTGASVGSSISGPGMNMGAGMAELSGPASWHPLQQTATFRRGVDLSRSMGASARSFAESLELEDQAARAEAAVLRLFSSTPMARPVASVSTLFPATMGSRIPALIGPSGDATVAARRSEGALVSSMPALSLSYAARTGAQTSVTAGARPMDSAPSTALLEGVATERGVANGDAAMRQDQTRQDQPDDTVSRAIGMTSGDLTVSAGQAASSGSSGASGGQLVVADGGQDGDARRVGPVYSTAYITPAAVSSLEAPSLVTPAAVSSLEAPAAAPSLVARSVSADPFGMTALDLGSRAQAAWLGAMGIRGPVRASVDAFGPGLVRASVDAFGPGLVHASVDAFGPGLASTTMGAAAPPAQAGGAGFAPVGTPTSASVAGALAGSTLLPGMVSLAAGLQRQALVGASTPALQRRLETLERASLAVGQQAESAPRRGAVTARGEETALGGDLSEIAVRAGIAPSSPRSTVGGARAFASGDETYSSTAGLTADAAADLALWARESLHAGQQAAGVPGATRQGAQLGAGAGNALSSTSEAETWRLAASPQRRLAGATSGQLADTPGATVPSMLTLAAAPLIGLRLHVAPTVRAVDATLGRQRDTWPVADMRGDAMTPPRQSVGAFVGAFQGALVARRVASEPSTNVAFASAGQPSESGAFVPGSRQSEHRIGQPGQPGMTGHSGSGRSIIARLPIAADTINHDGRVDRAAVDGSGPGSRDESMVVIQPLVGGAGSTREAQASGPGLGVTGISGAWWAGSAAPLPARFAQVRSQTGALNGSGMAAAVTRLLNGGEASPSASPNGARAAGPSMWSDGARAAEPSVSQRWAESDRDMAGRVHRALGSGEGPGQWATPPDPAALLMVGARDRLSRSSTDDGDVARRASGRGEPGVVGVPAMLASAMAASAMLPGMLSLAASVRRKAEVGVSASSLQTLGQTAGAARPGESEPAAHHPGVRSQVDAPMMSMGSVLGTPARASVVARLLDDARAVAAAGTGLATPSIEGRGGETGTGTVGRVHRALVERDDLGAHWSAPPDPAALLMARAQDRSFQTRAADAADAGAANLLRRSGSVGSDDRMSAPAALSGVMATSTMLPGMLRLAASVQRKAEAGAGTPGLQRRLQALEHAAGSTGRPLEATVRRGMETVLGGDLSGVRVHADTAAASAASMLGARAFALGNAVYFSRGAFAPGTAAGAALLAHELAHTRQQAAGALDTPQRSALPGHDAGEDEPPELEAHAQRTEASVLRLFSDAPLARQAAPTSGAGGLADLLSRRAEGGGQEASSGFSVGGPGAMLRRTAIATPGAGTVARTAAGAEFGGQSSSGSGGTLAGGMTVVGFSGATGGAAQRTARMDSAGGNTAVSRQSGDETTGALPQAGNVAGHGLPSVDELVGQVLDRVKRQIALDHERSGGFLSDLMR